MHTYPNTEYIFSEHIPSVNPYLENMQYTQIEFVCMYIKFVLILFNSLKIIKKELPKYWSTFHEHYQYMYMYI